MASIDLTYLNEISGGDKEFIAEMIETFLEETPKDIAELEKLLATENWAGIGLVAHKLKSSIKMFGFGTKFYQQLLKVLPWPRLLKI